MELKCNNITKDLRPQMQQDLLQANTHVQSNKDLIFEQRYCVLKRNFPSQFNTSCLKNIPLIALILKEVRFHVF